MEFRVIRSSQFSDEKPKNVKGIYKKDDNWYIKINTLEELIDFYNQYGDLIISQNWDNEKEMQIEIYDDYRE
jgi:hypothetical protein